MRSTNLPVWRKIIIVLIFIIIATADQLTKTWIRTFPLDSTITSFSFVHIIHIQNTGSAFGLFRGQSNPLAIFASTSLAVLIFLAIYVWRRYPALVTKWNSAAYGLIIGGTAGNLIDRLRFGRVTDFVDPGFWPVFNVADSAISVGAVMVGISLIRFTLAENKTTKSSES
jgi:signal peptidase II